MYCPWNCSVWKSKSWCIPPCFMLVYSTNLVYLFESSIINYLNCFLIYLLSTPMCRSERTFLHFANCTQIENRFCELCNLHKLIRVLQCVDLKDISSFCKLHSNWKPLLRIVLFAQITQIDNGTILQRVDLKRYFFVLQIALKLKTAFANCAICTNYTNW